jgi:glycerol uptake facilitator protein
MGWGDAALPDRSGGFFFVYILAPVLGGQGAALFFAHVLEPLMRTPSEPCECETSKVSEKTQADASDNTCGCACNCK